MASKVYETYTPPKPNSSEKKIARCDRRLGITMEEELAREKARLLEKGEAATSSVMSATVEAADDPLGKDEEKLRDEVKGCFEKANVPVEMQVSDMSVEKQDISDSFETPPHKCGMGETEALDEVDEPVIKCMEKEFDKALDDSAADSDDVDSEYAIHSRPSNVLKHDLRWTDENLKYLKGPCVLWQKVLWFEDHMFVMNLRDGIVYIDPWGVPCDMEQSSLAAFEERLV